MERIRYLGRLVNRGISRSPPRHQHEEEVGPIIVPLSHTTPGCSGSNDSPEKDFDAPSSAPPTNNKQGKRKDRSKRNRTLRHLRHAILAPSVVVFALLILRRTLHVSITISVELSDRNRAINTIEAETREQKANHQVDTAPSTTLRQQQQAYKQSRIRTEPIHYKGGPLDIVELSARHVEPPSNITAAVCYSTLLGDIDLSLVLQWVAYNRLLGFDHVYMFYRQEVVHLDRFNELQALPYVTLTENSQDDQRLTDNQCLSRPELAGNYDWAMVAGFDEYLRIPNGSPRGIKGFLQDHQENNLTYLLFGKYIYTLDHRTDFGAENYRLDAAIQNPPFTLSRYPFHMKNFCYGARREAPLCPTWQGRAKLIVKPSIHQKVDVHVHGNYEQFQRIQGVHHFHAKQAHFMEWPYLHQPHDVTRHEVGQPFSVATEEEVHVPNMERAFEPDADGRFPVYHDDRLEMWFQAVINRARVPGPPFKDRVWTFITSLLGKG